MDPEKIPLRDLHLPAPVDWWPLAPGWWILLGLAAVGLLYLLRKAYLHWRARAPQRIALRELGRLERAYEHGADPGGYARQLSQLLRRAMLAYAPRAEVAGLTGRPWREWLDRGLDDHPFTEGAGRLLESLPYRREIGPDAAPDLAALTVAVRRRLQTPVGTGVPG